jgi:hypothetical protein
MTSPPPDDDTPPDEPDASPDPADDAPLAAAADVIGEVVARIAADLHDWSDRTDPAVYALHSTADDDDLRVSALPVLTWIWEGATAAEGLRALAGIVYANGLPYPYHRTRALACAYRGPATTGGKAVDARIVVAVDAADRSQHVHARPDEPLEGDDTLELTDAGEVLLDRVTDALAAVHRVAGLP